MKNTTKLLVIAACACAWSCGNAPAAEARLGNMKADRILFLGNSITLCLPNNWGLSGTTPAKDYAHLLAANIEAQTGQKLRMVPMDKKLVDGEQQPGEANVLNVADVFERNYATYAASKLQYQINAKPDIVILQFGENVPPATFNAELFKNGLKKLVADLKESSDPQIFMAGVILGSNTIIDGIKRDVCDEDSAHRTFVDMSDVGKDASNIGDFGHPNDKGMKRIADRLFKAITARSEAERGSK